MLICDAMLQNIDFIDHYQKPNHSFIVYLHGRATNTFQALQLMSTPLDGADVALFHLVFFCLHLCEWSQKHIFTNNVLVLFGNLKLTLFMLRSSCQTGEHFRLKSILLKTL